ncbi:hypothetical protein [Deinococcus planocerae]|uniref:hypothetical protein n=1 Tax=Deinococcus planocerae TaxID=1737569 RepID=UPI0011AED53F|nr:hypothetical protein [Deinococcus planocerae]
MDILTPVDLATRRAAEGVLGAALPDERSPEFAVALDELELRHPEVYARVIATFALPAGPRPPQEGVWHGSPLSSPPAVTARRVWGAALLGALMWGAPMPEREATDRITRTGPGAAPSPVTAPATTPAPRPTVAVTSPAPSAPPVTGTRPTPVTAPTPAAGGGSAAVQARAPATPRRPAAAPKPVITPSVPVARPRPATPTPVVAPSPPAPSRRVQAQAAAPPPAANRGSQTPPRRPRPATQSGPAPSAALASPPARQEAPSPRPAPPPPARVTAQPAAEAQVTLAPLVVYEGDRPAATEQAGPLSTFAPSGAGADAGGSDLIVQSTGALSADTDRAP